MPDFRDRWMFVAGVGMSWLAIPAVLRRELFALAREVGGWSEGKTHSKLHAIFRTTHEAQAGKRVEWRGLEIDSRYPAQGLSVRQIAKELKVHHTTIVKALSDE
jgi:DNA-binding NarL/FixJ family response regulator